MPGYHLPSHVGGKECTNANAAKENLESTNHVVPIKQKVNANVMRSWTVSCAVFVSDE